MGHHRWHCSICEAQRRLVTFSAPPHEGKQWHVKDLPAPRPPGELAQLQYEGPPDECDGADRPKDLKD